MAVGFFCFLAVQTEDIIFEAEFCDRILTFLTDPTNSLPLHFPTQAETDPYSTTLLSCSNTRWEWGLLPNSQFILDFKLSLCSKWHKLPSGLFNDVCSLTLSNPTFLPPAYSPALIYFGRERGWWITCNYPTVLKEKNRNRKSTACAICWLKSVLHEEKRPEQENHNVGWGLT
jgi:hypothetical protein